MPNIINQLESAYSENNMVKIKNLLPELFQAEKDGTVTETPYPAGSEVYVTVSGGHYYRATLLGYGAYGSDPNYKTYCVQVHREDGYSFTDYFRYIFTRPEAERRLEGEKK